MKKIAKFNIGDVVIHRQQGYRAIIVDIDPIFQASGRYNPQAQKHEFAIRNPWYRLLIDGSSQETYVEETKLVLDTYDMVINNPLILHYLSLKQGRYQTRTRIH